MLLGFLVVVCCCTVASGQDEPSPAGSGQAATGSATGTVRGIVRDSNTKGPIPGATVKILNTDREVTTNSSGAYSLDGVAEGPVDLQIAKDRYLRQTARVNRRGEAELEKDIYLLAESAATEEAEGMEVFEVRGKLLEATVAVDLSIRRDASGQAETIGQEQMSQAPGSNVAEISTRTPAVSVKDGKFIFVRGLGERYSQTLLNGSYIPSPEPDKRVIPLDLFPVAIVESVTITKTYSPDLPGEFAGGSVGITTIDIPDEPFVSVGFSLKYRDGTTLNDFLTYDGGDYDMFGVDDGTRQLPDDVPSNQVRLGSAGRGLSASQIQTIGRSFDNTWDPDTATAPPDTKVTLSFGNRYGKEGSPVFGFVGAFAWANEYQTIENETFRVLKNNGTIDNPDNQIFNDFELDTGTFEAKLSGVLNLTLELNPAQKVGLRNLVSHSSTDRTMQQEGFDGQQEREIRVQQLRYVERTLFSTQLFGEHLLVGDTFLEWRASYALSQRDEPDNRQIRYDFDSFLNDFRYEDVSGSGRRDFYQLDENIYDVGFDYSIPFAPFVEQEFAPDRLEPDQKIKLGTSFVYRDRDFDARRFRFTPAGTAGPVDENGFPIDLTQSGEDLFRSKNINPDGFAINEVTRNTDNYEATQSIVAGYGLVDIRLVDGLRLEAGARVESSDQEVTTFRIFGEDPEEIKAEVDTTDILPAVNLTWEFYKDLPADLVDEWTFLEDMQLRLSGSRTVSRPEFRELAEFEFTDIAGGYSARGNPDLDRAILWNADLRLEWFPSPGDVVSASVFYKNFEDPIEQIILPSGSSLIRSWTNADSADLYGAEFEIRKHLGFVYPEWEEELRKLSLVINYTIMDSEVTIKGEQENIVTNSSRRLEGQPEFLLNLGLLYTNDALGLTMGVLANTYGKRISAVGAFGLPDEEEQQRWSLDVSIAKEITENATIKLSAENLLDDKIEFKQGDITTREYRTGWAIGLSYSVRF